MAFNINHYIPKFILKNFCDENSKNINLIDIINFSVYKENVSYAFTKLDFYDVKDLDDPKILEKKFNEKLESLVAPIIKKIIESDSNFKIYCWELELIKKYIAIQRYRNPANQYFYTKNYKGVKFSSYSKFSSEDDTDYWKREMLYILENDWETIINQSEYPGVKVICQTINSEYLTFFRSESEFVISDINCFTERIKIKIPSENIDNYSKFTKDMLVSQKLVNSSDIDKMQFGGLTEFDNYTFIVISPNLAVASIDSFWKFKYLGMVDDNFFTNQIRSSILDNRKNFSLPLPTYININKIKTDIDIIKYKDKMDEYIYSIVNLTFEETIHIMMLCLNEASLFLGYKNKNFIVEYIKVYNSLSDNGLPNIKNNYNGYIQLIESLNNKDKQM